MSNYFLFNNPDLIENMSLRIVRSNALTESPYTFQQQVQYSSHIGKWEADVKIKPLQGNNLNEFQAFLASLRGRREFFPLPIYHQWNVNQETQLTNITTNYTARDVGDTLIYTDNTQAGARGRIFDIDKRLHIVTDYSSYQNLKIEPPVTTTIPVGRDVNFDDPAGFFRLESDTVQFDINNAITSGFYFTCVQHIDYT